jgi:hypothetical protein
VSDFIDAEWDYYDEPAPQKPRSRTRRWGRRLGRVLTSGHLSPSLLFALYLAPVYLQHVLDTTPAPLHVRAWTP